MEKEKELSQTDILNKLFKSSDENPPERVITIQRIPIKLTVRAMTESNLEGLQKKYTITNRHRGVETKELDEDRYKRAVIAKAVIAIDGNPKVTFNSEQLTAHYNVTGGEQVVKRLLLPGEIINIIDVIYDLSGFYDKSVTEDTDELKNS